MFKRQSNSFFSKKDRHVNVEIAKMISEPQLQAINKAYEKLQDEFVKLDKFVNELEAEIVPEMHQHLMSFLKEDSQLPDDIYQALERSFDRNRLALFVATFSSAVEGFLFVVELSYTYQDVIKKMTDEIIKEKPSYLAFVRNYRWAKNMIIKAKMECEATVLQNSFSIHDSEIDESEEKRESRSYCLIS